MEHASFSVLGRRLVLSAALAALAGGLVTFAEDGERGEHFHAGNLVVSRSVYDNNAANVDVGTVLPPNCPKTAKCPKNGAAIDDGLFPFVFNNDIPDSSFGLTSKIFLDQLTPDGWLLNTLEVPNNAQHGFTAGGDQLVTSFSSKSELALNLSLDGRHVTFMGYVAPVDAIDVSNTDTPLVPDPTNPVNGVGPVPRAVASVDARGRFQFTETNAYSGNNGRAAILDDERGANRVYMAGNAGNGGKPQPVGVIVGAGAQMLTPVRQPESIQAPSLPTPAGSFGIDELGLPLDKVGKDTNFRGLTIFNHVVYYTKGSGGNGVNTVYFIDTTGLACPSTSATPGIGLPLDHASLPKMPITYDPSTVQTTGLVPTNMCILAGFPTLLASSASGVVNPFGLWFANDHTLYLADEGNGATGTTPSEFYTPATTQTAAGLQKWVLDDATHKWMLAYTLQAGLDLGVPYTVSGYPTGNNTATGLPWAPATDGLRNITGRVDEDGGVTIWAITSTISGSGDPGADPNKLVMVTDRVSSRTPSAHERFVTLRTAGFAEVLRGVSLTPGTRQATVHDRDDHGR